MGKNYLKEEDPKYNWAVLEVGSREVCFLENYIDALDECNLANKHILEMRDRVEEEKGNLDYLPFMMNIVYTKDEYDKLGDPLTEYLIKQGVPVISLDKEFQEGYEYFDIDNNYEDNPYKEGTKEYTAWEDGYTTKDREESGDVLE